MSAHNIEVEFVTQGNNKSIVVTYITPQPLPREQKEFEVIDQVLRPYCKEMGVTSLDCGAGASQTETGECRVECELDLGGSHTSLDQRNVLTRVTKFLCGE